MKKKTFYVIALIFSISIFSSAKKTAGNCGNGSICCELMKSKTANEVEFDFPTLGLFLFNN